MVYTGLRQMFLEMRDGALPGQLGGFFVVPLGRVVVEAVACPGVAVRRVTNTVRL